MGGIQAVTWPPVIATKYVSFATNLNIAYQVLATHTFVSPADSRGAVVSYWPKCVHEVLVNRLGGLSLPRKSVARLTDRPDMTLDVYRGRKTTTTTFVSQKNFISNTDCR